MILIRIANHSPTLLMLTVTLFPYSRENVSKFSYINSFSQTGPLFSLNSHKVILGVRKLQWFSAYDCIRRVLAQLFENSIFCQIKPHNFRLIYKLSKMHNGNTCWCNIKRPSPLSIFGRFGKNSFIKHICHPLPLPGFSVVKKCLLSI